MNLSPILEKIKTVAEREIANGNTTESNVRLENGELLWAALALMGFSYTQIRGQSDGNDASSFWPFGKFQPSETPEENLIRVCQFIIFEIDRLKQKGTKNGV